MGWFHASSKQTDDTHLADLFGSPCRSVDVWCSLATAVWPVTAKLTSFAAVVHAVFFFGFPVVCFPPLDFSVFLVSVAFPKHPLERPLN